MRNNNLNKPSAFFLNPHFVFDSSLEHQRLCAFQKAYDKTSQGLSVGERHVTDTNTAGWSRTDQMGTLTAQGSTSQGSLSSAEPTGDHKLTHSHRLS